MQHQNDHFGFHKLHKYSHQRLFTYLIMAKYVQQSANYLKVFCVNGHEAVEASVVECVAYAFTLLTHSSCCQNVIE